MSRPIPGPKSLAELLGGGTANLGAEVWSALAAFTLLQYGQGAGSFSKVVANGRKFYRPGLWALPGRIGRPSPHAAEGRSLRAWSLARSAAAASSAAAALRGLDAAVRIDPRRADLYALRALIRIGSILPLVYADFILFLKESRQPQEDLERALRLDPKLAWAHLIYGILEYLRRRFGGAQAHFARAVELEPNWDWARILKADAIYYLRRTEEALAEFDAAIALNPGNAWAYALRGRAKNLTRDISMKEDLDRAIALEPGAGWIYAWRGIAKAAVTNDPSALKDYDRAKALDRDYDRIFAWRGSQLIKLHRYQEALADLRHSLRLNAHIDISHYSLGRVYFRLGRVQDGVREIRKAVEASHLSIWIYNWGDWNHQNHARRETLVDLDAVIAHNPRAAWALAWRGQTRLSLKEHDAALTDFDEAISLDPGTAYPYAWRGEAYRSLGRDALAAADFQRALSRDPRCVWAYAWRGALRLESGFCRQADLDFSRALRLNRRTALAYVWRFQARYRLGRISQALADIDSALEFYPTWKWLWLWRARLLDRLGRPPEAVLDALGQAISLAPKTEILVLRAYYLGKAKRWTEAARQEETARAQGAPALLLSAIGRRAAAGSAACAPAWIARRLKRDGPWDLVEDFFALEAGEEELYGINYDALAAAGPPALRRALDRLRGGRPPRSIEASLDAILRDHPEHYGAAVLKADCMLKSSPPRLSEAEAMAERGLAANPGGREALLLRYQARKRSGNWSGALQDLEAVHQAQDVRVTLEIGRLLLLLKRSLEALQKANEVLELEPFNAGARRLAAQAKLAQGDCAGARRLMRSLLDVMPGLSWPHLLLARAAFLEGGAAAALRSLAPAFHGPAHLSAQAHGWKAVYLAALNRRRPMRLCLKRAVRLDPSRSWHARIERGLAEAAP